MEQGSLRIGYRLGVLLVLAAVSFLQSGCLLAAAGLAGAAAAGTAYAKGKICALYNARPNDAWAATRQAVAEMGMPILEEEYDGREGMIRTRTAEGDLVRIYLEARTSGIPSDGGPITKICIRVATFGDWPLSERIMAQIGAHLAPPQVVAAQPPAVQPMPGPVLPLGGPQTSPPPLAGSSQQTAPPPELPRQPVPIAR